MNYLMIDEERQAAFRGQYKEFGITLRMSSEDVLSIAVENTLTLERFSRDINREYISQQDTFFQSVFEGVKDIYEYLRNVVNEIVIEGELLLFDFRYGNNKVKRIGIQLIREDINEVELANRKMEKMQENFTAQLLQKDIEIKELKQKQEVTTEILQEIKGEVQTDKQKIRELQEIWRTDFQQMKGELQTDKVKNFELAEALRAQTEKIQAVAQSISFLPVEESKKLIKLGSEEVKVSYKIGHHLNNAHKNHYTLKNLTATLTRITRKGDDSEWYNFVNKFEVLPNQKTKYSLTINKTADSQIMIGFCTEKGLGNKNHYLQPDSAYYHCWDTGFLNQGGQPNQIGVGTHLGETVECVADLESCQLSWWKKGSQIAKCAIPAQMRIKPIYISILLYNTGDEVDLSI